MVQSDCDLHQDYLAELPGMFQISFRKTKKNEGMPWHTVHWSKRLKIETFFEFIESRMNSETNHDTKEFELNRIVRFPKIPTAA